MQRVTDADAFLASPLDRYVIGPSHIAWCHGPELCGSVVWGRPSENEVRELVRCYEIDRVGVLAPRFDVVTDASSMELVTAGAFATLVSFLARRLPSLGSRIRRNAIVPPRGLAGAIISGIYPLLGASPEWRLFADPAAAFAWLATPAAIAAGREVAQLVTALDPRPPIVRELRAFLARNLVDASLAGAARALKLSTRSLQRQLETAGTTLRRELELARVEQAMLRLEESDIKLEVIAIEVGYASASHFTHRFRTLTGESPSEYRARRRSSDESG